MPNWCSCELTLNGPQNEMNKFNDENLDKDSDIDLIINLISAVYEIFMDEYTTVTRPEICSGKYVANRQVRTERGEELNPITFFSDKYWYEVYLKIRP